MTVRTLSIAGLLLACQAASADTAASKPAPSIIDTPADIPSQKMDFKTRKPDAHFIQQHEALVAKAKKGGIDLYFAGDSITDRWLQNGKEVWTREFAAWKPGCFGIGGDRTQHLLWRLGNGELEGVAPRVFVVLIGANNLFDYKATDIAAGTRAIVQLIAKKNPQAKILVLGMLPLEEKPDNRYRKIIKDANAITATLDDGKNIRYLDIGAKLLTADGTATKEIFPDGAHLSARGYQIFADAIKPTLTQWLGAPAAAPVPPIAAAPAGPGAGK